MKISASATTCIKRFGLENTFRMFKEAGFDGIDYPIGDRAATLDDVKASWEYGKTEDEIVARYSEIKAMADKAGIIISQTHSLYGGFPVDVQRTPEFADVIKGSIIATHTLGCCYTVVHPVRLVEAVGEKARKLSLDVNEAFYRQFIPFCRKYNVKIAIEDLGCSWQHESHSTSCSNPEDMVALVNRLGRDCFCTCADIGHFALIQNDIGKNPGQALRELGDTIGVIHLHEVDLSHDSHTVPFTFNNVMDWEDITSALKDAGFQGFMNLEVMGHVKPYPDALVPEALRHIVSIARYLAGKVEG